VCYWGGDKVICTYLGHIRCSPVPFLDDILKNEQVGKVSQKLVMVVLRETRKMRGTHEICFYMNFSAQLIKNIKFGP
jgi:hypothetical protein